MSALISCQLQKGRCSSAWQLVNVTLSWLNVQSRAVATERASVITCLVLFIFHDHDFYLAPLQVGTPSVRWWDLRAVQSFMRACCSVGPYLDVYARFMMQSLCTFQLHVLICFETIVNLMLRVQVGLP